MCFLCHQNCCNPPELSRTYQNPGLGPAPHTPLLDAASGLVKKQGLDVQSQKRLCLATLRG